MAAGDAARAQANFAAARGERPARGANLYQRVLRAEKIAAARGAVDTKGVPLPVPWASIAAEHGLSVRQAQNIYNDFVSYRERTSDPLEIVEREIMLRESLLDHLGALTLTARQPAAQVGAAKAMLEVAHERMQLLQAVGRLPRNLLRYQAETQFSAIVREMMEIMERSDIPPGVVEELNETVRRHLGRQDGNVVEIAAAKGGG